MDDNYYESANNLPFQIYRYPTNDRFLKPKKVVISSKKYDIRKLTLNLDTLNLSVLG